MAQGTFVEGETKTRPGIYFLLVAKAQARISRGTRGRVALPVRAEWGPTTEQHITDEAQIEPLYWKQKNGDTVRLLNLAWKTAPKELIVWRLTGASAAAASVTLTDDAATPLNVVQLPALYKGARPNAGVGAWKMTISTNIDDATKKDAKLYEGSVLLATWTFDGTPADLVAKVNLDGQGYLGTATKLADGSGAVVNTTGVAYAGGDSGLTVTNQGYLDWLTTLEAFKEFDAFALDGVGDSSLQDSVIAWLKRVRTEGLWVQSALGAASDADPDASATRAQGINNRSVTYVASGGYLSDDPTVFTPAEATAWVAAKIAVTPLNQAFTGAATPFTTIGKKLTNTQINNCLAKGAMVFEEADGVVYVEDDINTFNAPTTDEDINWANIQISSILDAVQIDLALTEGRYKGKIQNTPSGRSAIIGAVLAYYKTLFDASVVQDGYTCTEDPSNPSSGKVVNLKHSYTPVGAVKQIYNRTTVAS